MVFRFVLFGQLWRSRVWLRCKRSLVGKFRHVAIMMAALRGPLCCASREAGPYISWEACAFLTHPQKGMTLGACSLGDFARGGDRLLSSIDKGLTETPETLPSTFLFLYMARGRAGTRRASTSLPCTPKYVAGSAPRFEAAPFLACLHNLPRQTRIDVVCVKWKKTSIRCRSKTHDM